MKSILEDIKTQNFKQAYLLYGEEAYLKHQYKNKLKNALLPEDDTMNFSRFEGKGTEIPKVIDLAETMPFFADRRVILLENTGFFKNKADALADYMGSLPDYLVLIFVEEEVDKRNRMYKAVQKQGRAVEFARQDEKTLMTWVLGMMKKEGKKITRQDMEDFLEKTGTGYGKYLAGAGKTAQLYDGKRCDHAGGYRGSLHNADYEPDFRDDPRGNGEEAAESARSVSGSAGFKGAADADSLSAGTPVQSAAAGQRAAGRALRSGDDRKTDGTAELRCAELYSHVAPVCGGGIKSGGQ